MRALKAALLLCVLRVLCGEPFLVRPLGRRKICTKCFDSGPRSYTLLGGWTDRFGRARLASLDFFSPLPALQVRPAHGGMACARRLSSRFDRHLRRVTPRKSI